MKHKFQNAKIVVGEDSKEIQEILFGLGYRWAFSKIENIHCLEVPFLFIYKDGKFTCSSNNIDFYSHKNPLITLDTLKQWVEEPKKEVEFKPFDKVLVRDGEDEEWEVDMYRKKVNNVEGYNHVCFYDCWKICIPYEGNEHLL